MTKQGMRRYKPGDGMNSEKSYGKSSETTELQGKSKQSNKKAKPV